MMRCARRLQVINHLQDCAKDYRELNRVYIPEPMLQAAGIGVEALAAGQGQSRPDRCDFRLWRGKMPACWKPLAPLPAASTMAGLRWRSI